MAPSNVLPIHGNEKTMNLNTLILTNIQASPYFKVNLYELKTYHQVVDEIYYKVDHLEPWEKGSRKTAGQTGMCGGVRGVGAGGIVSSAFCLLYKLYTLKLTRKQLIGLCTHADSPYIRGLGFMYIRFTQPSADLWEWFEPYLDDEEQLDVKAGGGHMMTIGELVQHFLTKLDWYSTLFPRIAVPVQKQIEQNVRQHKAKTWQNKSSETNGHQEGPQTKDYAREERQQDSEKMDNSHAKMDVERDSKIRDQQSHRSQSSRYRSRSPRRSRSRENRRSSRDRHRHSHSRHSQERRRSRSHSRRRRSVDRNRSTSRDRRHAKEERHRSDRHHEHSKYSSRDDRYHEHHRSKHGESENEFERDLRKEMERIKKRKASETSTGEQQKH